MLALGALTSRVFLGSPGATAADRSAGRQVKSMREELEEDEDLLCVSSWIAGMAHNPGLQVG